MPANPFSAFAGFLGTLIGAGGSIWVLAACTAGGFAYAACAASEVLKRMRALRIDGEYAKSPWRATRMTTRNFITDDSALLRLFYRALGAPAFIKIRAVGLG